MTDDERFERDLGAIVREGAPDHAPSALRVRVGTSARLASTGAPMARPARLFASAAGLAAVLVAVAIVGPRLVPTVPGATDPASHPATAFSTPNPTAPSSTTVDPSTAGLDEPITNPGKVQFGGLLTPVDGWALSMERGLLLTHSGGDAWRDVTPSGATSDTLRPFFVDPSHGWLSEGDRGNDAELALWRTTDGGMNWSRFVVPGVPARNWDLVFLTPLVGWLASDAATDDSTPELRWTDDGGATWSAPIDLGAATGFDNLLTMTFVDQKIGFVTGQDLFRITRDGGRTWSDVELPPDPRLLATNQVARQYAPPVFVDSHRGYLVVDLLADVGPALARVILETSTAGLPIAAANESEARGLGWRVALRDDLHRSWAFLDENTWIGTDGRQVWTTRDGGATFSVANSVGFPDPFYWASMQFVDPTNGWAVAQDGYPCPADHYGCPIRGPELFRTSDGGVTWARIGDCIFKCNASDP